MVDNLQIWGFEVQVEYHLSASLFFHRTTHWCIFKKINFFYFQFSISQFTWQILSNQMNQIESWIMHRCCAWVWKRNFLTNVSIRKFHDKHHNIGMKRCVWLPSCLLWVTIILNMIAKILSMMCKNLVYVHSHFNKKIFMAIWMVMMM